MGRRPAVFNKDQTDFSVLHHRRHMIRRILGLVALAVLIAGCNRAVDQRGNLPEPERMAEIKPGATTKDQVAKILGTPSSVGVFDDLNWYYISKRTKQVAFFDPDVLDQQVFVIAFDSKGVVRSVDHKDLKDARAIDPAPGATPAPGRELSFLEQLLGNVGRFAGSGASSGTGGGSGPSTGGPSPTGGNR